MVGATVGPVPSASATELFWMTHMAEATQTAKDPFAPLAPLAELEKPSGFRQPDFDDIQQPDAEMTETAELTGQRQRSGSHYDGLCAAKRQLPSKKHYEELTKSCAPSTQEQEKAKADKEQTRELAHAEEEERKLET